MRLDALGDVEATYASALAAKEEWAASHDPELTQRLKGTWYACENSGTWASPPVGIAFDFTSSPPSFAFIRLDPRTESLVPSTRDGDDGDLIYIVPVGPADGGNGSTSTY